MQEQNWYAAKCIFFHAELDSESNNAYEERVVLLKANSFDEAIERAEKDAEEYCGNIEGCSYTGFVNVFHLFDTKIQDGTEIYSLMRTSNLDKRQYLDQFYNTGQERTQDFCKKQNTEDGQ